MGKLELLKLADDTIPHIWLIDRIASGFKYELIASDYKATFDKILKKTDFDAFKVKFRSDVRERYEEMRDQVYNSGVFAKMTNLVDVMFSKLDNDDYSPREFSAVASTLRGYLEDLTKFGAQKTQARIKTQNNYLILQSLEKEGLLDIKDENRLKRVIDGEIDETESE